MEVILAIVLLLIIFAVGPFVAMLDFMTFELSREGRNVSLWRLAGALMLLWVPFVWIAYFVFIRRRPPFA